MNNREALLALLAGKRVRDSSWDEGEYICFVNDMFIDKDGDHAQLSWDEGDTWELYVEPKKKVKYAPVLRKISNTMLVSSTLFTSEEDAREWADCDFVRWLIDTHAVEVEE